jgi:hypothetical protein
MANTNTGNQQKKVYTASDIVNMNQQAYDAVDEQAILNKYNQATAAQFVAQQDQNRIAENNFYNQMYNTQKTAMDTIRQSNANAVSTGASRGVQAANELSALLGLQQESIASATEIANARRQTAQEETAAMLQNIVQASQDAANQKQQAMQSMIQAQSLQDTENQAVTAEKSRVDTARADAREHKDNSILIPVLKDAGKLGPDGEYVLNPSAESQADLKLLLSGSLGGNVANYQDYVEHGENNYAYAGVKNDEWRNLRVQLVNEWGLNDPTEWQNYCDYLASNPKTEDEAKALKNYSNASEYVTAQRNNLGKGGKDAAGWQTAGNIATGLAIGGVAPDPTLILGGQLANIIGGSLNFYRVAENNLIVSETTDNVLLNFSQYRIDTRNSNNK